MFKKIYFAVLAVAMAVFASCNTDGDNNSYLNGVCTLQHSGNLTMWMDGGAIIYPSASAEMALKNNKGFDKIERAYFLVIYQEENATTDASGKLIIRNAEIGSGQGIETFNFLTQEQAERNKVLEADSISDFKIFDLKEGLYCADGYMTIKYNCSYLVRDSKGVLPSVNAVYSVSEEDPSVINVNFYLNKHAVSKDDKAGGDSYFLNSFRLNSLNNMLDPSISEFTFNFSAKTTSGEQKHSLKVKRDFFKRPF